MQMQINSRKKWVRLTIDICLATLIWVGSLSAILVVYVNFIGTLPRWTDVYGTMLAWILTIAEVVGVALVLMARRHR
jgi:hypothetical protein